MLERKSSALLGEILNTEIILFHYCSIQGRVEKEYFHSRTRIHSFAANSRTRYIQTVKAICGMRDDWLRS